MIWKPVKLMGRRFIVSNLGRVRDEKGKAMRKYTSNGYSYVCGRVPVKNLIAKAFCKGYKKGLIVNHLDGIRDNDRASNLEWTTHSENIRHAHRTGLVKHTVRRLTPTEEKDIIKNPLWAMEKYNITYKRFRKIVGNRKIIWQ